VGEGDRDGEVIQGEGVGECYGGFVLEVCLWLVVSSEADDEGEGAGEGEYTGEGLCYFSRGFVMAVSIAMTSVRSDTILSLRSGFTSRDRFSTSITAHVSPADRSAIR
jgi:hypothetical protein